MTTLLSTKNGKTKLYQTDQQVKYLHLEAEVDILLQKLTFLKEEKQTLEEVELKSSKSAKLR